MKLRNPYITCGYLGRAKKFAGVWLLEEFGEENFRHLGKHYASIEIGEITLCLLTGDVWGPLYRKPGDTKDE